MSMTTVEIQVPEEIARFAAPGDDKSEFARNAMIIWPYIRNGTVSRGWAANKLGVSKMEMIEFYCDMGLPYFDQTPEEFEKEMQTIDRLLGLA